MLYPENRPLPVSFYKTESGKEPVREWLKSLTGNEKKTVGEDIKELQFGWPVGMPLVKKLETDLWEIRSVLDGKISRIILTIYNNSIILLHGFIKKSQKISLKDIQLARKRLKKLKRLT